MSLTEHRLATTARRRQSVMDDALGDDKLSGWETAAIDSDLLMGSCSCSQAEQAC
ncbi:hypothetical protein J2T55_001688 [Methylohalomonas lacus]|uniref:Uncharacterized protein n=1 Tax=Methylohalomonas lacus TaxID=398773 RepID=A0AAE3HM41_9GAMM|nr:hypothetical protein [Methylohalomonas lacus]